MTETLAQKQKRFRGRTWPGRCCVFTVAGGNYQYFAPLFCKQLKKSYPEYDVRVLVPGELEIPETPEIIGISSITPIADPLFCAALRFVLAPQWLQEYDYVLITDIDIVIIRENPTIIEQHMMYVEIQGTEVYDNFNMGGGRMPGVHFVTREWWPATEDQRMNELNELMEQASGGTLRKDYDEWMLGRIVNNSGLPPASMMAQQWNNHGLHLGAVRDTFKKPNFELPNQAGALALLAEDLQPEIEVAAQKFSWLKAFVEKIRQEYKKG